jgi:hypothetical protein
VLSKRADYANFHLRAEIKFSKNTVASLLFRYADVPGSSRGYETYIGTQSGNETGTLDRFDTGGAGGTRVLHDVTKPPVPSDTWFTLEVIADRDIIQVLVNGEYVTDLVDGSCRQGQIGFKIGSNAGQVEFRKIEIKELPATMAAQAPTSPFQPDPMIAKDGDGLLTESGVTPVRTLGEIQVYYPRPFANPPNLSLNAENGSIDYLLEDQKATGFKLKVSASSHPPAQAPQIRWNAKGLPGRENDNTKTQEGAVTIDRTGDFHVHYPRPYARPPHFQLVPTDGLLGYELREQTADGFKVHINARSGGIGPKLHWRTVGVLKELPLPEPVQIKAFDPAKDKPATEAGVTPDQGGWRIEVTRKQDMLLFVVPGQGIKRDGRLILRGQSKATPAEDGKVDITLLWRRENGYLGGTHVVPLVTRNDWQPWTNALVPNVGPSTIEIGVRFDGPGKVWLKDLELVQEPTPAD